MRPDHQPLCTSRQSPKAVVYPLLINQLQSALGSKEPPGAGARFLRHTGMTRLAILSARAAMPDSALPDDLADVRMEALLDIEVTLISKKPRKQSAAV